jgi:hypothetical protein
MTRAFNNPMEFANEKDQERAEKINKILHMNNAKISYLVQKQMKEPLTEFDKEKKKKLHKINDDLVTELKAMPRKGKIGLVD